MVGAIDFLRKWVSVCQKSKCSNCELFRRNACPNQLERMSQDQIPNVVKSVIVVATDQERSAG